MRNTITLALSFAGFVSLASGCDNKGGPASTAAPEQTSAAASASPSAAPTATAAETAAATASAMASAATAAASASAAPSASAAATPATSGSAAAGAKTFDCGAKGQKPCPMQGWMKSVMASASSSGDGEKLASALSYVAGRSPPGFGNWSSIANAGVAQAKAGDIEGAKKTCKQCHDSYKEKYKTTMRDRPF